MLAFHGAASAEAYEPQSADDRYNLKVVYLAAVVYNICITMQRRENDMKNFIVSQEIFDTFPGLRIVTVIAKGIGNPTAPEKIDTLLQESWEAAAEAAEQYGNPQSHPHIKAWVDSLKAIGVSRKKFPSSIEAMVRRAGKSEIPFRISPIVDFYNAVSLKNIVPAGGFDIDQVRENIELRFSKDGDIFQALDSELPEAVSEGEVSYADGNTIITRHMVWKQSRHTLLTEDSRNILFVSEILGSLEDETAQKVADDLVGGLHACFGASTEAVILDRNRREVMLG